MRMLRMTEERENTGKGNLNEERIKDVYIGIP